MTTDTGTAVLRYTTTGTAAIAAHCGDAASMICGSSGEYRCHLNYVRQVLGDQTHAAQGALSLMMKGETLPQDTHWIGAPAQKEAA